MPKVADFIEQHREALVEGFAREAARFRSATGITRSELIDSLSEYLTTLAAISRQGYRGDSART
ncbi:MAG: hypothetical protein L0Y64_23885, partial [Myxococcaceae bacterium]|nr:hypothetical protein [Myxococcaceae bacterium]